jgi:hypothetical protein
LQKEFLESLKDVQSGPLQRPIAMMKKEYFSISERGIETRVLVAALVATVTFAAANIAMMYGVDRFKGP